MHKSRLVAKIKKALKKGNLSKRFDAKELELVCPGFAHRTYGSFLPKHRIGNPGKHLVHFKRYPNGKYSLLVH